MISGSVACHRAAHSEVVASRSIESNEGPPVIL